MLKKEIQIGGIIVYILLSVLALYFYLERTIFNDVAFHLFYMLKDGNFAIQRHRYISAFTQIFPLIGSKFNLGLAQVMQLYSLSFVLFNLIVFLWLTWLKQYRFALVLLLLNTLMLSHSFYWPMSELPQGIALVLLLIGIIHSHIKKKKNNKVFLSISIALLLFLIVFSHPLVLFPFGFIVFYFALKKEKEHLKWYGICLFIFTIVFVSKFIFLSSGYEKGAMGGLKNIVYLFPHYFSTASTKNFLKYIFTDYYLLIIILGFTVVQLILQKKHLKLALTLSFFFGYLFLINTSYPNSDVQQFYIENLYLPLSIFVAIPFVFDILPLFSRQKVLWGLVLVFSIRLVGIYTAHQAYTQRVEYLSNYTEQLRLSEHKKQIVNENLLAKDSLLITWGTPFEVWLLSTLRYKNTLSFISVKNTKDYLWVLPHNKKFLTRWGSFDYKDFNSPYFIFEDTTDYVIIDK